MKASNPTSAAQPAPKSAAKSAKKQPTAKAPAKARTKPASAKKLSPEKPSARPFATKTRTPKPLVLNRVIHGENLAQLLKLPSESVQLIYIDPPFNTGNTQRRLRMKAVPDEAGDRTGFGGRRYRTEGMDSSHTYHDSFDDYIAFLRPRLLEAHRILTPTGSLFLHIDPRESHYCKILLDEIFTRPCFQNEIIWAYDYGARPARRWPAKHDSLFWYTKHPKRYTFHRSASDRIPYMAPTLVGAEKAARGKTPTDVWWHTIVSPTGKEKTGYPTQKPLGVLERILRVHSSPGDTVLDFFAGSGTTGVAAARNKRHYLLIDKSRTAARLMRKRLASPEAAPQ